MRIGSVEAGSKGPDGAGPPGGVLDPEGDGVLVRRMHRKPVLLGRPHPAEAVQGNRPLDVLPPPPPRQLQAVDVELKPDPEPPPFGPLNGGG